MGYGIFNLTLYNQNIIKILLLLKGSLIRLEGDVVETPRYRYTKRQFLE